MSSLKGYIPALARLLAISPAALYERQRALVRAGLIESVEGRGPGSGARLDIDAVALLLLSILATDRLSESADRTSALASCKPATGRRCPHTGATTFRSALAAILFSTGKASATAELLISRTSDRARIRYFDRGAPHKPLECEFVGKKLADPPVSAFASIRADVLSQIADDVQGMVLDTESNEQ